MKAPPIVTHPPHPLPVAGARVVARGVKAGRAHAPKPTSRPTSPQAYPGGGPAEPKSGGGNPYPAPTAPVQTPSAPPPRGANPPAPHGAGGFDPRNPSTWGAGMTSQQMSEIIKTQIADAINPQVTGLKQQQSTYDEQQRDYQNSLTGYYKALAGMLQGEAPAVSAAYNSAAGATGSLAQGLTGDAKAQMDAQNASDQNLLANAGQTQASGYLAGKVAPGAAALNPFYSEHGLIPGSTLAQTGAARATEAAAQPGIFAAKGADNLTGMIQKAVEGDQGFQQKIADIYNQVPGLRDRILTQVQQWEIQKRQLRDTETELGIKNTTAKASAQARLATIKLQENKLTADIAHWNAQLQSAGLDRQTRVQIAAQQRAAQVQLTKLRGAEARQTAIYKKQNGIGSGSSTGDWAKTSASIGKQAEYLFNHPLKKGAVDPVTGKVGVAIHQAPQAVFNTLWSMFVNPYLKTLPANQQASARNEAKRAIKNAMTAAGFPPLRSK